MLIETARRRIDDLNGRHGADRFFLFHRSRQWNARENKWMGVERKRGKLAEFNHLLRGATDTSFVVQHGETSILPSVRYVITLDSDTQLPMEAARKLVGTLSHPLNRPRFDARLQRVTEGYGVLQPRINVSVVSANRTKFSRIFSGHVGVDPYTTAVSDLYQDMFHEGSYVGKGIYDVDAFEAALAGRVPENTLLSHDLFEGFYARAGLVTDIDFVDDYPGSYLAHSARQHRWVRGDWQIARWLWRSVPDAARRSVPNTLPVISRWKILDNLRRSLIPPALVLLLAAGWTLLPGSPAMWTTLVVLVLAFPAYIQLARSIGSHVPGVPLPRAPAGRGRLDTHEPAPGSLLDRDPRASERCHARRHRTGARADAGDPPRAARVGHGRSRREGPDESCGKWCGGCGRRLPLRSPSPLSSQSSRPIDCSSPAPSSSCGSSLPGWSSSRACRSGTRRRNSNKTERAAFRLVARRTWRFFEELVGPSDHHLIPDNYQEDRQDVIAHRTSPTNIGLQLLATVAAADLGYLSYCGVVDRLEPTFDTLLRMQRYRGHFYNWYDTRTLAPLTPAYISTVDSGNLAGYLLTLRSALTSLPETAPIIDGTVLEGLDDVLTLFEAEIDILNRGRATTGLRKELGSLRTHLARRPGTLLEWRRLLTQVEERLQAVSILFHDLEEPDLEQAATEALPPALTEATMWLERAAAVLSSRQLELDRLTGWLVRLQSAGVQEIPTGVPSLTGLIAMCDRALNGVGGGPASSETRQAIDRSRRLAEELIERGERLSALADDLIEETEFGFLFNAERQLFSIGYSVTDGRLDGSHYDTLASEARLASFMAIATGTVSHEHWFKLGRSLTPTGSSRALLSWSASMFEYLMPLLVMRAYPGTLLDETYNAVVRRQIEYGTQRGVPWGISESAYYAQDLEKNYQYRAFGVPGLGLKRGLADDLVVAPYASALAAPIAPHDVLGNFERLRAQGPRRTLRLLRGDRLHARADAGKARGRHGVANMDGAPPGHDPARSRQRAQRLADAAALPCRSQGAGSRSPAPGTPAAARAAEESAGRNRHARAVRPPCRSHRRCGSTPRRTRCRPRAHLLSNGSYTVMLTNAGGGYSRRQQLALTRWREDITSDNWGSFVFVRDLDSGDVWSTTHQPSGREADEYEVSYSLDRAVFRRLDTGLETRTEVVVSPEDDVELRRVSITNHSHRARNLDLTSYAEVVLAPGAADLAHPAFSNLFVETTAVVERDALLCTRRPRSGTDRVYLFHMFSGRGRIGAATEYETDRARFIGRGRSLADPVAMSAGTPLSNTTGAVLDPIVSLRQSIRLPPGGTARLAFITGFAENEATARRLIDKYFDRRAVARAIALASTHAQIELRHLGLTVEDTMRFQRLASRLMFGDPRLREADAVLNNRRGQPELWKYGISGDLPIVLATIEDGSQLPLLSDLLKAHEYLRGKGMAFDLVVLNAHAATYRMDLQDAVQQMVESGPEQAWLDRPGGVFLRRTDLMPAEDVLLLRATARAVMEGVEGGLEQQLVRPAPGYSRLPDDIRASKASQEGISSSNLTAPSGLEEFNGIGGFAGGGKEYVIRVHGNRGVIPPAPWVNVVAHPTFGFAASDLSTGFTWSENSHDNRLTPWRNDPVGDPPGEVIYLRDEQTGRFWSATPLPAGGGQPYTVRHGHGYSAYEHNRDGIDSRLLVYVAAAEPVKVYQIALRNSSNRRRQISVTLYVDWVLGENREKTGLNIVTRREPATGALLASNVFREAFADRVAFLDLFGGDNRTVTGDRTEFIGRNGSLRAPAALSRETLSNQTGATLDPCGAVQLRVTLDAGSGTDDHRTPRRGHRRSQRVVARPPQPRTARRHGGICRRAELLEAAPRHRAGEDARSRDGSAPQRLAALSDAGVPDLGTLGFLPVERRIRLPRSAAGRARVDACGAAPGAQPHRPCRVPAVHRRRRPALVARTGRAGRADQVLGRSAVAGLRDAAVHACDRGHRRTRRGRAVSRSPSAQARRARGVREAHDLETISVDLRTLRARHRPQPDGW